MTWKEIKAKREERAKLFNQATELRAKADRTAEDNQKIDKMFNDVESIGQEVERMERELELGSNLRDHGNIGREEVRTLSDEDKQLRAAAYVKALRQGENALNREERALLTTTTNGVMVPDESTSLFFEKLKSFGGMRLVAQIITTATGGNIPLPVLDDTANEGEQIVDGDTVGGITDPVVTEKELGAKIFDSKWIAVSRFLLEDASFDLAGFIDRNLDIRIARKTNAYYTAKLLASAAVGYTQASSGGIEYEDFIELEHSVDPVYRTNAVYMLSDDTLKSAKLMTDTQGRPLWVPGVAVREPDTINGKRYVVNADLPSIETQGAKSLVYGDFSNFLIRDVAGVFTHRDESKEFASKLQVGFLKALRSDGDLINNSAVKVMVNG